MSSGLKIRENRAVRFSVIVPTFNRPDKVTACVKSLQSMDYPKDRFEVIVVNDGGASVNPFSDTKPDRRFRLILENQDHGGPAAARNRGAALSKGAFFVFLDDDCEAAPSYLGVLEAMFQKKPEALVGGRTVNAFAENPFAEASQALVEFLSAHSVPSRASRQFLPSNNMAVARRLFLTSGGFDLRFPGAAAEDRDFCSRWIESGRSIAFCPEAVVVHGHDLSLASFVRQHFHYGKGAVIYNRLRMRRTGQTLRPEPPSFYLSMLRYPFDRAGGKHPLVISLLIGLSQAANAAGFFWGTMTGIPLRPKRGRA